MSLAVQQSPMKEFLNYIANYEHKKQMQPVHDYLRTVFSEQRLRHFARYNVEFDQSFIDFIHRTATSSVKTG